MKKKKILLLMSGGVDSSVAALLLRDEWEIIGATMKTPGSDAHISAKRVADSLGFAHHTLETEALFSRCVIEKAVQSRALGLTPNPCADCNKAMKFGAIPKMMQERLGISDSELHIATGHYARIRKTPPAPSEAPPRGLLVRAAHLEKDQSYFLCDIPREILNRLHFPLGELSKREVREIAHKAGLEVADKPESMDACFELPKSFERGHIVNLEGKILGEHCGIYNYTIGQRKGLGIAYTEPLFVVKIDALKNQIVVGTREDAFVSEVEAESPNILAPELLGVPLFAKTRSRGEPAACELVRLDADKITVRFKEPSFAPTPGQRLVCYTEDGVVVLSGVIKNSTHTPLARGT